MTKEEFFKLEQSEARAFAKKQIDQKLWSFEQAFRVMQEWREKHKVTLESAQKIFG